MLYVAKLTMSLSNFMLILIMIKKQFHTGKPPVGTHHNPLYTMLILNMIDSESAATVTKRPPVGPVRAGRTVDSDFQSRNKFLISR